MRIVIVGAGSLGTALARVVSQRGHDVVLIEQDKRRIEALQDQIDAGFLDGDGTRPAVLRETSPKDVSILFATAGDDRANILCCLVARSLGIPRVVPRIGDEEFEHVCLELGLNDTVIPSRAIALYLADMAEGRDILDLKAAIKGDARVFVFVAREEDAVPVAELGLPSGARVTHLYREGEVMIAEDGVKLRKGDEVVLVTTSGRIEELHRRFAPPPPGAPPPRKE